MTDNVIVPSVVSKITQMLHRLTDQIVNACIWINSYTVTKYVRLFFKGQKLL